MKLLHFNHTQKYSLNYITALNDTDVFFGCVKKNNGHNQMMLDFKVTREGNALTRQVYTVVREQHKLFHIENFTDMTMKLANIFPLSIDTDIRFCFVIGKEIS